MCTRSFQLPSRLSGVNSPPASSSPRLEKVRRRAPPFQRRKKFGQTPIRRSSGTTSQPPPPRAASTARPCCVRSRPGGGRRNATKPAAGRSTRRSCIGFSRRCLCPQPRQRNATQWRMPWSLSCAPSLPICGRTVSAGAKRSSASNAPPMPAQPGATDAPKPEPAKPVTWWRWLRTTGDGRCGNARSRLLGMSPGGAFSVQSSCTSRGRSMTAIAA